MQNNDFLKVFDFDYPGDIKKYGFMDDENRIIIKPKYEEALDFSEGFAAVCVKGRWGFIDESDNIVVECKYEAVKPFCNGYARVANRRYDNETTPYYWGFINKIGAEITPIVYEEIENFSEGFAIVKEEYMKYSFINEKGENIFNDSYTEARSFHRGYAIVAKEFDNNDIFSNIKKRNLYGLIDKDGIVVEALKHYDSKSVVIKDQSIFTTNENSSINIPILDNADIIIKDDTLYFVKKRNKWGVLNDCGETVCNYIFDDIKRVNSKYIQVKQGEHIGLIDNSGRIQVPVICKTITTPVIDIIKKNYLGNHFNYEVKYTHHIYNELQPFSTKNVDTFKGFHTKEINLLILEQEDRTDLFSMSDGFITNGQYQSIHLIDKNLFIVESNSKFGLINNSGSVLLPADYEEIRYSGGNDILCKIKGKWKTFDSFFKRNSLPPNYDNLIAIKSSYYDSVYINKRISSKNKNDNMENTYHVLFKEYFSFQDEINGEEIELIDSFGRTLFYSENFEKELTQKTKSEDFLPEREIDYSFFDLKYLPLYFYENILLVGNNEDMFGFYDLEKKIMIVPFRYSHIIYRDENLFDICKNDKWGVFDLKECKEILPCKYDYKIPHFFDKSNYTINGGQARLVDLIDGKRICIIKEDGYYGCINDEYNEVIPAIYHHIMFEKQNRYIFCGFNGRIANNDNELRPFSGYVSKAKWGCFDNSGYCIIPIEYNNFKIFERLIFAGKGDWEYQGQYFADNGSYSFFKGKWTLFSSKGEKIAENFNEFEIYDDRIQIRKGAKYVSNSGDYDYIRHEYTGGLYSTYDKRGNIINENFEIKYNNSQFYNSEHYSENEEDYDRDSWDALTDGQYGDFPGDDMPF